MSYARSNFGLVGYLHTSVANKSSEPYRWLFRLIAWIEAAVGKSYFLLLTEVGGCESLQKRKEHIRVSTLTLNNGLTKSRHPTSSTILKFTTYLATTIPLHFHYYLNSTTTKSHQKVTKANCVQRRKKIIFCLLFMPNSHQIYLSAH